MKPQGWSFGYRLGALLVLGVVVRLTYLGSEPAADLAGDEPAWTALAEHGFSRPLRPFAPANRRVLSQPPLYPLFLALTSRALGTLRHALFVQAVLGALLVVSVGRIGQRVYSEWAGLLAAAIVALYPSFVWFSAHFYSETLFVVLLWFALERLLAADASERIATALLAGVLWGLATLTREPALYFSPFAAACLWWRTRDRGAALRALSFLLAVACVVGTWTYRNWRVFHAVIPVSTSGAFNLWLGNASAPRDEVYALSDSLADPVEQDRLARRSALSAIGERQPLWLFEKLVSEMPPFWDAGHEALLHVERGAYGRVSPRTETSARVALGLPYVFLIALLPRGLVTTSWRAPNVVLLWFLVYYAALHVVAFGYARFRLPLEPLIVLLAAQVVTEWRAGRLTPLRGPARALVWALTAVFAVLIALGLSAG